MTAVEVIESYGIRWSIESMFNQLKLAWGLKEAWQQTRQTLHRRVHLTIVGYGLVQLMSGLNGQLMDDLCCHSPWRKDNPKTAGKIRKGLGFILRHVRVIDWWSPTYKKFEPPDEQNNTDYYENSQKQRSKRKKIERT